MLPSYVQVQSGHSRQLVQLTVAISMFRKTTKRKKVKNRKKMTRFERASVRGQSRTRCASGAHESEFTKVHGERDYLLSSPHDSLPLVEPVRMPLEVRFSRQADKIGE